MTPDCPKGYTFVREVAGYLQHIVSQPEYESRWIEEKIRLFQSEADAPPPLYRLDRDLAVTLILCKTVQEGGIFAWKLGATPVQLASSMLPYGEYPRLLFFNALSGQIKVSSEALKELELPPEEYSQPDEPQILDTLISQVRQFEGHFALVKTSSYDTIMSEFASFFPETDFGEANTSRACGCRNQPSLNADHSKVITSSELPVKSKAAGEKGFMLWGHLKDVEFLSETKYRLVKWAEADHHGKPGFSKSSIERAFDAHKQWRVVRAK